MNFLKWIWQRFRGWRAEAKTKPSSWVKRIAQSVVAWRNGFGNYKERKRY